MAGSSNEWKPSKKQAEFLSLPYTIPEAAYAGGAGSGKTDLLLLYPLVHKFHENPKFKQLFLRRTYPEIRDEIIPRSEGLYRPFGATLNQSTMTWKFPSGARVILGHCQEEKDVHRYDSTQINLFTPDEITSFTEWQYLYISLERVRSPAGSGLPAITRCCGMPGNIGHTWFKKRFVDPCPSGGKIIVGKGGRKRFYIHSTLLDNPGIDPNYKQNLLALPEAERKAKLSGDWDAFLGSVFDEFRTNRYPDEPENALHVIEPFEIPGWWPRIVAGDWGFAAMTWVGFGAISPKGRLYIYRELAWKKTKIAEWAPIVKRFIDIENVKLVRFCKSAGQDRGQEHTIQQQIQDELDQPVELSQNTPGSRIAGKLLIHEYLRWQSKPVPKSERLEFDEDRAAWLLRNKGLREYKAYLESFRDPTPEQNLPKLQIFNTCSILINAIRACVYDTKNVEDIAEFDGDDPVDGLRYLVDAAEGYVNDSANEFDRIQKQEKLVQQLEQNKDWTAFYRRMERLDDNPVRAVSRFHRR
jgi:hypothetical protein